MWQESRRIVIAVFQNTVYNEFLPTLLGPDFMTAFKLNVGRHRTYFLGWCDILIISAFVLFVKAAVTKNNL